MEKVHILKHARILREKIDMQRRTVACMLIQANVPDLHGDIMYPDAITQALDSYMETSQVVGRMHSEATNSFPARVSQDWDGSAIVETKVVDDADWAAITNGEFTGLSWAGFAYRAELGDGMFLLTEPEMLEYSFVDKPAVPAAVFKDATGQQGGESLCQQIASGKVKPRVRCTTEARKGIVARAMDGVKELIENALSAITLTTNHPASGGESNEQEIDMELKEFQEALAESNKQLLDGIAEIIKPPAAETGDTEIDKSASATAPAADMTAEIAKAVTDATEPLKQQIEAQAAEIAELKKQPGPSGSINSDGTLTGEAAKAPDWERPVTQF